MIEKFKWLWEEADKVCHEQFHFGVVLFLGLGFGVNLWWCIIVSEIWGVGYEICDMIRLKKKNAKAKFDWRDIIANNVGMIEGIIICLIILLIKWIVRLFT